MALDIDEVKKQMEAYIGSEEHKKALDRIQHLDRLKQRNVEKIRQMSIEERCVFIQKVYDKYTSDEYRDKELKLGYYEARNPLYDIIFDYAVQYGKPSMYDMNDYFPEEQYDIDGEFIVGEIYGQGSFIFVKPIADDEIIPHYIKENEITIYKPNGEKVITTDNVLIFNDIRLQIKNKGLSGYYIIFKNKKYEIKINGKITSWPNGLFDTETHQLANLIRPNK